MKNLSCRSIIIITLTFTFSASMALDWPVLRDSTYKPIGNSFGQYQQYEVAPTPFMHSGIDIMCPTGTPVYAIKAGQVKAVMTTSNEAYWRVLIADSASDAECNGYMYAHLDEYSITVYSGQWVEEGQHIGNVVYFPYHDFNHIHFSKIRYSGPWWDWQSNPAGWEFVGNPLDDFDIVNDPDPPVFENAMGSQKLAFCQNQSSEYFVEGQAISGDVDIICRVYDYINDYEHRLAPYSVEYKIGDAPEDPWIMSVYFGSSTGPYANNYDVVNAAYQDDETCNSIGDWDIRQYYFNLTNNDGDSLIELEDKPFCWQTAYLNNGPYKIYVRASDKGGNVTLDSMTVMVENHMSLEGTVVLDDVVPQPNDGIVVSILSTGASDTTDSDGLFSIDSIGGGDQLVEISRAGFMTADTMLMMNQNRLLNMALVPGGYLAGDANCDVDVNVGDAVYVINYVFKGGPAPIPYIAADANGDGDVNVADAVYLISYIFKGGPPPVSR